MNLFRPMLPLIALSVAASASAQAPVYGVWESYFGSNRLTPGAVHQSSWGEFNWRAKPNLKLTYSFGVYPGGHYTDEACLAYSNRDLLVRVGRIRTEFGFSNWSDLLYNGFTHTPLVRSTALVNGLGLSRQDSGVEVTKTIGGVQIEAAAFETPLERDQITPNNIDTGIVRAQTMVGPVIVGLDALKKLRHEEGIYGFDLRYTIPHLVTRAEYFTGSGPNSMLGYYADAEYRLPRMERTQLVGRTEMLQAKGSSAQTFLHTVGLRQIVTKNFQLNVNYGWGTGLNIPPVRFSGSDNWSARAMFQIQF